MVMLRRRRQSSVDDRSPAVLKPGAASSKTQTSSTRTPYRTHFTIVDKSSSWLRRSPSYRCVEWVFGLASLNHGGETTGHHVTFTWTKNKRRQLITRVFWNRRDITNHVRRRSYGSDSPTLEYSWGIPGGETIMIFVNFSESVVNERDRYVLFVDGDTFTNFPTLRDLEASRLVSGKLLLDDNDDARSPRNSEDPSNFCNGRDLERTDSSSDCSQGPVEYPKAIVLGTEMSFRLSMAGLDRRFTMDSNSDCVKDELHSDLFSPVLESVREQITHYLPQADRLVSRAITNAFCAEDSSLNSSDATSISLMSGEGLSGLGMEANMLMDAFDYKGNAKVNYLQRRIEELFMGIRNDCLEPEDVSRIALNVAIALGFELTQDLPSTTILINGIPKGTSEDELLLAFSRFGEMDSVAIASSRKFGFCRFSREESARRAVESYQQQAHNDDDGLAITLLESKSI